VEMLEPYEGRVFDPCAVPGMFVQSEKFIAAHPATTIKRKPAALSLILPT